MYKQRDTHKIEMTPAQESWMIRHFKHTKNSEIAERFGWSESTLHRFARQLGLTKTPQFQKKMQHDAAVKAKQSHIANGTYPPKGYIIPNSEQYRFRPGERTVDRIGEKREAARIAKATATRRNTLKEERARAAFGLPQRTRMRVKKQPRRATLQRYRLRKLGYEVDRGSMTAYYGPDTRRSLALEQRTKECRHYIGFTYLPLPSERNAN